MEPDNKVYIIDLKAKPPKFASGPVSVRIDATCTKVFEDMSYRTHLFNKD